MANQQLLNYIKDSQNAGFDKEQISEALKQAGWQDMEIEEGFDSLKEKSDKTTDKSQEKQEEKNHKNTKLNKKSLILIVGFIVLMIAAIFVFFNFFTKPSFAKVMSRSISSVKEVNSFDYQVFAKIELEEELVETLYESSDSTSLLLNINGGIDFFDKKNINTYNDLKIETDALGEKMSLNLDTKKIDDNFYLKVSNLPSIVNQFISLDMFLDTWFEFDIKEKTDEFLPEDNKFNQLTKEENLEIIEEIIISNFSDYDIFYILEEKNVVFSEKDSFYYKLKINPDEWKEFSVNTSLEIYKEFEHILEEQITQEEIEEIRNDIDEQKEQIEALEFEIWIGKDDYYPYKISLNSDYTDDENAKVDIKIELIFSNFNQVEMNAPSDTKPIEDVFESIEESLSGGTEQEFENDNFEFTTPESRNARRVSDIRQIQTSLELYYNDKEQYPDSGENPGQFKPGETFMTEVDGMIFMDPVPTSPAPADCINNDYVYSVYSDESGINTKYCLRYCLSEDIGSISAGDPIYASHEEINMGSTCPYDEKESDE